MEKILPESADGYARFYTPEAGICMLKSNPRVQKSCRLFALPDPIRDAIARSSKSVEGGIQQPCLNSRPAPHHRTRTPARLGRSALERVLARAAELHNTAGAGDPTDAASEVQLLEFAPEVGLSDQCTPSPSRRTHTRGRRLADESGWLVRLQGPGIVSAARTIRGQPADVIATLGMWMEREECLQVQRRFPDRVVLDDAAATGLPRCAAMNQLEDARIGSAAHDRLGQRSFRWTIIGCSSGSMSDATPKRTMQVRMGAIAGIGGIALSGTLVTLGVVAHAALPAVTILQQ